MLFFFLKSTLYIKINYKTSAIKNSNKHNTCDKIIIITYKKYFSITNHILCTQLLSNNLMPVVDFKRNSNSKGINKKSKNIKLISNSNLSEEAEKILLTPNSIHLPNNTLKNSDKTLKSLKNIYKDKKKLILKDQKLHNQISKNKETNLPKKGLTMTISTKTISY